MPTQTADAIRLLKLKRGYSEIENGLHYTKDVTVVTQALSEEELAQVVSNLP